MQSPAQKAALPAITLAALGVVFGDIGTSPLYALRQCFLTAHLAISEASVLGILSLIFWCMMLSISFKYVTIIMRADNNGEGGIMSLLALNLRTTLISDKKKVYLIALGFIGASLFFGDGIITPAISVLSAIEGLSIATPIFNQWLEPLSIGILTGLFLIQRHGTGTMGKFFGPITLLFIIGINILHYRMPIFINHLVQAAFQRRRKRVCIYIQIQLIQFFQSQRILLLLQSELN
jgi:KUP system potassium uptake protein